MHDYSTDTRILRKLKIKPCGKQALVLKTNVLTPTTAWTLGYSDENDLLYSSKFNFHATI